MRIKSPDCTSVSRQAVLLLTLLSLILLVVVACAPAAPALEQKVDIISLSSLAFKDGAPIPAKYTGDGQDISPPLEWGEPPPGTRAFALIVEDPDAPGRVFTHWVLFNLTVGIRQLSEGIPAQTQLENGAFQGKNDFGKIGYSGPRPPAGSAHRYYFTLYALAKPLELEPGASKRQVLDAMEGNILAQGQLMGTYRR